ncbi:TPA: DUF3265 domain-containing protein [Vibrio parahaemolyticus]|nr:DUF3265 domain-containing protein [Vibrio parahaemolyticus]HCH3511405.1 DUF3265 domain-containing protein [Vibrio parahaemolyticus]HCH4317720.1 DUF3265 domain-containing protein [Vibrio parahaemolyticus]
MEWICSRLNVCCSNWKSVFRDSYKYTNVRFTSSTPSGRCVPEIRHITRRLSGIHAAWHFWYAVNFGGESALR